MKLQDEGKVIFENSRSGVKNTRTVKIDKLTQKQDAVRLIYFDCCDIMTVKRFLTVNASFENG